MSHFKLEPALLYTLRHFPDRLIILEMSQTARLREWLGRPSDPQIIFDV